MVYEGEGKQFGQGCIWGTWPVFEGRSWRTGGCHLGVRKMVNLRRASDKARVPTKGRLRRVRGGFLEVVQGSGSGFNGCERVSYDMQVKWDVACGCRKPLPKIIEEFHDFE